jgi:hypothetical protein
MAFRMQSHRRRAKTASGAASVLAVALLGAGCWPTAGSGSSTSSGSGTATPQTDPPVIDSLDMSQSPTFANNTYTVFGSVTFEDDDDVVVSANVYVYVTAKTYNIAITPADLASEGTSVPTPMTPSLSFPLTADPPLGGAGPTNYSVTLVNKSGAKSQAIEESVDLQ